MFGPVRLSPGRFTFKTKSEFVCASVRQFLLRLGEKVFLTAGRPFNSDRGHDADSF